MTNSDLRSIPHQKCTEFKQNYLKSILFFYQKFPAVANGEEEEDDDDDDEKESHDVTVVDTEEVNVHDKLHVFYSLFHVK